MEEVTEKKVEEVVKKETEGIVERKEETTDEKVEERKRKGTVEVVVEKKRRETKGKRREVDETTDATAQQTGETREDEKMSDLREKRKNRKGKG